MNGTMLETRQVTKIFGGLTAVNEVDLVVPENAIVSIIGPHGAGKTTLFNRISGFYTQEFGPVLSEYSFISKYDGGGKYYGWLPAAIKTRLVGGNAAHTGIPERRKIYYGRGQ